MATAAPLAPPLTAGGRSVAARRVASPGMAIPAQQVPVVPSFPSSSSAGAEAAPQPPCHPRLPEELAAARYRQQADHPHHHQLLLTDLPPAVRPPSTAQPLLMLTPAALHSLAAATAAVALPSLAATAECSAMQLDTPLSSSPAAALSPDALARMMRPLSVLSASSSSAAATAAAAVAVAGAAAVVAAGCKRSAPDELLDDREEEAALALASWSTIEEAARAAGEQQRPRRHSNAAVVSASCSSGSTTGSSESFEESTPALRGSPTLPAAAAAAMAVVGSGSLGGTGLLSQRPFCSYYYQWSDDELPPASVAAADDSSAAAAEWTPPDGATALLGKGTSGRVYRVHGQLMAAGGAAAPHAALETVQSACKWLPKSRLRSERDVRQLVREIMVLRQLEPHPNIVRLLDVHERSDRICLYTELVHGSDLRQLLARCTRIEEPLGAAVFAQVALALLHAHRNNVVHRDLKLENVLVSFDDAHQSASIAAAIATSSSSSDSDADTNAAGELQSFQERLLLRHPHATLIDFGLCDYYAPGDPPLLQFCGSPAYAAPEVVQRQPYDGFAADVWSLGVLLFAMLTGTFPFYSANLKLLFRKVTSAPLVVPRYVSPAAADLLTRMLVRAPDARITLDQVLAHPWLASTTRI